MTRPKVIIASVWAVAIVLLVVALAACGGGTYHRDNDHGHMPVVHTTPAGCHWSDVTHKQRKHVRVNGRWKYVTIKTHTKALVCHH